MEQNRLTIVLVLLVPQILSLLMEDYDVDDEKAAEILYSSELYKGLEDEQTKLWHLSAEALYEMLQEELKTGCITYPEEA